MFCYDPIINIQQCALSAILTLRTPHHVSKSLTLLREYEINVSSCYIYVFIYNKNLVNLFELFCLVLFLFKKIICLNTKLDLRFETKLYRKCCYANGDLTTRVCTCMHVKDCEIATYFLFINNRTLIFKCIIFK